MPHRLCKGIFPTGDGTVMPHPGRPHARRCFYRVHRYAPYIRIVMQHSAIGTIHGFSRFAPVSLTSNQLKERFVQFAEVGYPEGQ